MKKVNFTRVIAVTQDHVHFEVVTVMPKLLFDILKTRVKLILLGLLSAPQSRVLVVFISCHLVPQSRKHDEWFLLRLDVEKVHEAHPHNYVTTHLRA